MIQLNFLIDGIGVAIKNMIGGSTGLDSINKNCRVQFCYAAFKNSDWLKFKQPMRILTMGIA